ncbi:MAG TPA: hypothetical protein VNA04_00330 [Thermoanaerobaculia bacterium]|nr:hypothetical protein [Thermoanaerobaculia bacterium]
MEHDFLRAVIVTVVAGTLIVGAGATLLFFVFRAIAEDRKGERKYAGLSLALFAFIFICCAVFFSLSLR